MIKTGKVPLKAAMYFNISLHTTSCLLLVTKQTCCTAILESLEENIEYQTWHRSNYRNIRAPYFMNTEEKV